MLTLDDRATGWTLSEVRYPQSQTVNLGFQDEPLAIYQGDAVISARLHPGSGTVDTAAVALRLHVQACSDEICLLPEDVTLELPTAGLDP